MTLQIPGGQPSKFVQRVSVLSTAVASGATLTPYDDTIPQITEGQEFMTLAITPQSTLNILKITIVMQLNCSIDENIVAHLHQDAVANALSAVVVRTNAAADSPKTVSFTYVMVAGTVSATTFRARAGAATANTVTFNGAAAARRFGGVCGSSITIEEYKP